MTQSKRTLYYWNDEMRFGLLHALAKHMDVINRFALFRVLNVAGDITDKHNEGHFPYKDVII